MNRKQMGLDKIILEILGEDTLPAMDISQRLKVNVKHATVLRELLDMLKAGLVVKGGTKIFPTYRVAGADDKPKQRELRAPREFVPLRRDPFEQWRLRENPETSQAATHHYIR